MAEVSAEPTSVKTSTISMANATVVFPRVTITYCTQCRWMLRAAYYAQELLSTFSTQIGEVALQPATGGVFTVGVAIPDAGAVGGGREVQLWDRKTEGGFPETKQLKALLRDLIDPSRDLGHIDRSLQKKQTEDLPPELSGLPGSPPRQITAKQELPFSPHPNPLSSNPLLQQHPPPQPPRPTSTTHNPTPSSSSASQPAPPPTAATSTSTSTATKRNSATIPPVPPARRSSVRYQHQRVESYPNTNTITNKENQFFTPNSSTTVIHGGDLKEVDEGQQQQQQGKGKEKDMERVEEKKGENCDDCQ